jgi:hypothetical protein
VQIEKPSYSKTAWRRLGNTRAINLGFLLFSFVIYATLTIGFDAAITANFTWLWSISFLASFALCAIPLVIYRWYLSKNMLSDRVAPWVNLVVVGAAGVIKNTSVPYIAHSLGLHTTNTLTFRVFGGAFTSIALFVLFATVLSARYDHQVTMAKLAESESQLLGYRESASELLQDEQELVATRVRSLLLPRIHQLQESLSSIESARSLANRLRETIESDIRPLNKELAQEAAQLSLPSVKSIQRAGMVSRFPLTIDVSQLIRPNTALPLLLLSYFLLSFIIYPAKSVPWALAGGLLNWGCLWLFKLSLRASKPIPTNLALILVSASSAFAVLPAYLLLGFLGQSSLSWALSTIFFLAGVVIPTLFAWSVLLDFARADAEAELRKRIEKIARENKIFEQKLWISRNTWATLLHGSVQSALTAALIRTQAGTLNHDSLTLIETDLERATTALNSTPRNALISDWSLNDLKQTWAGICEIEFSIEHRHDLLVLLESSEILPIVLNEVFKELVSNAIRHGGATQVAFKILQSEDRDLQLICTNNGSELGTGVVPNLGTKLFEQLLLNPVLTWDASTQKVTFTATIPVQRKD